MRKVCCRKKEERRGHRQVNHFGGGQSPGGPSSPVPFFLAPFRLQFLLPPSTLPVLIFLHSCGLGYIHSYPYLYSTLSYFGFSLKYIFLPCDIIFDSFRRRLASDQPRWLPLVKTRSPKCLRMVCYSEIRRKFSLFVF